MVADSDFVSESDVRETRNRLALLIGPESAARDTAEQEHRLCLIGQGYAQVLVTVGADSSAEYDVRMKAFDAINGILQQCYCPESAEYVGFHITVSIP